MLGLNARRALPEWALIMLAFSAPSHSHEVGSVEQSGAWSDDVWLWGIVFATGALYLSGYQCLRGRSRHRISLRRRAVSFAAGWLATALALLSPLDSLGALSFSAHMMQHEILMLVAAPLLVASQPLVVMIWGLAPAARRLVAALIRMFALARIYRTVGHPVAAWLLHAVALWSWHMPLLFQAALRSEAIHAAQHLSFLLSALLFWAVLLPVRAHRTLKLSSLLYLLTTAMHNAMLGALLALSSTPWYPHYPSITVWGWTALEDQQFGGLIMWVPAGAVYLCAALVLCARRLMLASGVPGVRQRANTGYY